MSAAAHCAGVAPVEGDDFATVQLLVHAEPVAADDDELSSAFGLLASLLLDFRAARQVSPKQGVLPTPSRARNWPDARPPMNLIPPRIAEVAR